MADVSFEKQNKRLCLRMNTCKLITTRDVTTKAKLNGIGNGILDMGWVG